MEDVISGLSVPELIIVLALGLLVLLFGYRVKKIAFFIAWFILGYLGVSYFMPEIAKALPEIAATKLYQILIPIGGGLLLALLGFSIEKFCVSGICFALVMFVAIQYFGSDIQTLAIAGIIGVVVAGAATMLMKPATIIATAGVGAYAITLALLLLITGINREIYYWPMLIGLTVIGSGFQFLTTKRTI
ncbi:DUF4203 domain-containing protein [Candidatus Saccharibacteria bacterium]|nr:DUF4203 domain-containing protein [Candidatus Saccharibacteria bacterium]